MDIRLSSEGQTVKARANASERRGRVNKKPRKKRTWADSGRGGGMEGWRSWRRFGGRKTDSSQKRVLEVWWRPGGDQVALTW